MEVIGFLTLVIGAPTCLMLWFAPEASTGAIFAALCISWALAAALVHFGEQR